MTPSARTQAAIEILDSLEATKAPADRIVQDYFRQRRFIGSKDRRAISEMIFGVMRARARLDWWLDRAGAAALDARRRVLAYVAIVGEDSPAGVFDGSKFGPARLSGDEMQLGEALQGRSLDHPEQPEWLRLETPEWLWPPLQATLGGLTEVELAALNQPAGLDLRVNRLQGEREEAQAKLAEAGIETLPGTLSPLCLRADGRKPIAGLDVFREGLVEVQDEGSQIVALLTGAAPGMRVCDFCAGAGGKSLAMAAEMANKGHIVACDTSKGRLDRSAARFKRAGVFNIHRRPLKSARDVWVKKHRRDFDRVLVDAPCSGSGTWRRNPDAKWRLRESDIDELIALQAEILDSASRLVRPGGRLVYATCSFLEVENQRQADRFLAEHDDFRVVELEQVWSETLPGEPPCPGPYLQLLPGRDATDGFFAAVFERQAR